MHSSVLHEDWDEFILIVPLVALLVFGYFRVDEIFGKKKQAHGMRRPSQPAADPAEESMMTDPDGRPWK